MTDEPPWFYSPRGLYPFQAEFAARSYMNRNALVAADTGLGKQAPVSEPVLTPTGWRPIGSLSPGDEVIGLDGFPTEVLGVYPQDTREVYRVTFSDGSWTRCGPDHLWTVQLRRVQNGVNGLITLTMSLRDIVTMGVKMPGGRRRFRIPITAPVQFPEIDLPIDPYVMGVILGDGSINEAGYVQMSTDEEILDAIGGGNRGHHRSDGIGTLTTARWKEELVALGLAGQSSHEKFVPPVYLFASEQQRRELLAGLLDTDGCPITAGGGVEFSSTSPHLIEAVEFLAQSLGGIATQGLRTARRTTYTYNGEKRTGRVSYRVNVKMLDQPFRLARKADRWIAPTKYPPARHIESVERVDDEDSVCILVSNDDGLYLTRSCIVTHNTIIALATAALLFEDGKIDMAVVMCEKNKIDEWVTDVKRFCPRLRCLKYAGPPKRRQRLREEFPDADVVVCVYQTGREDMALKNGIPGPLFQSLLGNRTLIVWDEMALLGGRTSMLHQTNRAMVDLCRAKADTWAMGLTATPMTSSPETYYNLGLLLCPDAVGTPKQFYRDYVDAYDIWGAPSRWKNLDALAEKMSGVLLRKHKTDPDVRDKFPAEVERWATVSLDPKHKEAYDLLDDMAGQLGAEQGRFAFNSLRAFACHPRSVLDSQSKMVMEFVAKYGADKIARLRSAKTEALIGYLNEIIPQGDGIIVFATHTSVLYAVGRDLTDAGIPFAHYNGDMNERQREGSKGAFKSGAVKVLLASSAAERGINLPEASYIVNYDVPLQHATHIQRLSRGSRIDARDGGTLFIKTYIAEGTVEHGAIRLWEKRNTQSDILTNFDALNEAEFVSSVERFHRVRTEAKREGLPTWIE